MAPGMCCNTFQNINDGTRDVLGTYAEWERNWTPQWATLFGARNDIVWMNTGDVQGYSDVTAAQYLYVRYADRRSGVQRRRTTPRPIDNFDFTALARYSPDDDATYEFGYTRKTRSPSIFERYAWSTGPWRRAWSAGSATKTATSATSA